MVRLLPDRMRSKVTASYHPMVIIDSFDLISQPLRAASFPSRGSLCALPFLRIEFVRAGHAAAPTKPRRGCKSRLPREKAFL